MVSDIGVPLYGNGLSYFWAIFWPVAFFNTSTTTSDPGVPL
jgi:hypothetical protein